MPSDATGRPVVIARFRDRQPDDPSTLRKGRLPEIDPGEQAATCDHCGYWGIVDTHRVLEAQHDDQTLACQDCAEDLGWSP